MHVVRLEKDEATLKKISSFSETSKPNVVMMHKLANISESKSTASPTTSHHTPHPTTRAAAFTTIPKQKATAGYE
jgi:hypothetical protein